MTDMQLAGLAIYILIGYMIADTFLVKVDSMYWLTLLLYPLVIVGFFLLMGVLWLAIKYYEAKEWMIG